MSLIRQPVDWQRVYYLDFTQQANLTIASGANTIDGKSWTGVNVSNAATFAIQQGTGLVIAASSANTDYFNANRTTPLLRIPVSSLVPNYSIERHIVRFACRILLTNANANFEFAKMGVEHNSSPTNFNITYCRGSSGGSITTESHANVAQTTTIYAGGSSFNTEDVGVVIWEAPQKFEIRSGFFSDGQFPQTYRFRASAFMVQATPLMVTQSDPYFMLLHQTDNSDASFTATFTHLAVDVVEKFPLSA